MRSAFVGAVLGLVAAVEPACAQDIAAQPAYPIAEHPATVKARPKPKSVAAKPVSAEPEQTAVRLPPSRPASAPTVPAPAAAVRVLPPPKPAAFRTAARTDVKPDVKPGIAADIKPEPKREAAAPAADPLAGIPADERTALRAALLWSAGDDARPAAGEAKPAAGEDATTAAIKAYQKRNKAKVTGILTDSERANLLAAAKARGDKFGWSVVTDPATGIRIGVPGKLVPQVRETANGTHWSARHGEIQVETFRIAAGGSLAALYEKTRSQPALRLESSALRADGFSVSGLQGLKQIAVHAQMKNGELRGYTVRYDQAMEGIMLPVLPAIANAFSPFSAGATPMAALSGPADYGTGVVVTASGYIVTTRRNADGCAIITIPGLGNADRVVSDDASGLALLRVYGHDDLKPAELAQITATPARDVSVIGVPDPRTQDGGSNRSEIKAQLGDSNSLRPRDSIPMAGFGGAAALDGAGRVLGVVEMRNALVASVQPALPPVHLVPATAIRELLAARNIALPQGSGSTKDAIVRVICVRP